MTALLAAGEEKETAASFLQRYPGAKSGAWVFQTIINEMPRHAVYCEPFVGSGAILLRKRPATCSIVIDADSGVADRWSTIAASGGMAGLTVHHGDARSVIASYGERIHSGWLIYADPPYVRSARRSSAPIYRHEMSDQEHVALIHLLRSLPAKVMLSGYRTALYDERLAGWRRIDFRAMTRAGPAIESLWCNFPADLERHEFTYLGANYRERERIKRKRLRWRKRLAAMPALERRAILEELTLLELASSSSTGAAEPVLERRQARRCAPAAIVTADDEDRTAAAGDARSSTDALDDGGHHAATS